MKITFNEYCRLNQAIYNEAGELIAWFFGSVAESVDAPDLKSVDHKGRGGSSPPAPITLNIVGYNKNPWNTT